MSKNNILLLGSCRIINSNFKKYNSYNLEGVGYIHNHNEFLSIIDILNKFNDNCEIDKNVDNKNNYIHNNLYSIGYDRHTDLPYIVEKLKKLYGMHTPDGVPINKELMFYNEKIRDMKILKKSLLNINNYDTIILEICTDKIWYEEYILFDKIFNCPSEFYSALQNWNNIYYIKFGIDEQKRDEVINCYYHIRDINISYKNLYNFIKIGNYRVNKDFTNVSYDKNNKKTVIQLNNMTNDGFLSFGICFQLQNLTSNEKLFEDYTIKTYIECDTEEIIYIKYQNINKTYTYTDQTVNSDIVLNIKGDPRCRSKIGFYIKNKNNEIMTKEMLEKNNINNWNLTFKIKSYKIIPSKLPNTNSKNQIFPKKFPHHNCINYYRESKDDFLKNFLKFVDFFKNKNIIVTHHLVSKNESKVIKGSVQEKRIEYISFLKNKITGIPNCYFFENYVDDTMVRDNNHYTNLGHKIKSEKLEMLLDKINNNI